MLLLFLFIGIVASVVAGYLTVELIHNIQFGEGMKILQDTFVQGKVEKQAFISLVTLD